MHEWAPPTAGVNFVVLGRPVEAGSTEAQRWLTALGRVSPARRWMEVIYIYIYIYIYIVGFICYHLL